MRKLKLGKCWVCEEHADDIGRVQVPDVFLYDDDGFQVCAYHLRRQTTVEERLDVAEYLVTTWEASNVRLKEALVSAKKALDAKPDSYFTQNLHRIAVQLLENNEKELAKHRAYRDELLKKLEEEEKAAA